MPVFTVVVDVDAPVTETWQATVDWPAHGRWIPLTTVRVLTGGGIGVGATFVGRTGLGPIGFDDPMEIVEWRPPAGDTPGRCAVTKLGRVLTGSAVVEVAALDAGHSRVSWTEDVRLAGLSRRLDRVIDPVGARFGRWAFRGALRRMAAEVATGHGGPVGG